MIAHGTINMIVRGKEPYFEAVYEQSYRHSARRLAGSLASEGHLWLFRDEAEAVAALERQAAQDGVQIRIQAGAYPRGTRQRGDIIA